MRIIYKIILMIGIILILPFYLVPVLQNWKSVLGSPLPFALDFNWLIFGKHQYLFWIGIVSAAVLVIMLLVIIIWPRPNTFYLNKKSSGQVAVSKKAIENFILSSAKTEPYINNPKVSAKLSRKKLKIGIKGNLLNSIDSKRQTEEFLNRLQDDLKILLGISEQKKIKIYLTNFKNKKSNLNHSRVI